MKLLQERCLKFDQMVKTNDWKIAFWDLIFASFRRLIDVQKF